MEKEAVRLGRLRDGVTTRGVVRDSSLLQVRFSHQVLLCVGILTGYMEMARELHEVRYKDLLPSN
jgi:hypothetical protein